MPNEDADIEPRCAICGWPLAESVEKGCVRGNCSQRPWPPRFYDPERAVQEYGYDVLDKQLPLPAVQLENERLHEQIADLQKQLAARAVPREPDLPINLLDSLHDVFTRHGVASRTEYALVGDVIRWAAQAWRQTPREPDPPAWQPIETAPKVVWQKLLGATEVGVLIVYWDGSCWRRAVYDACTPTHWMLLPEPPAALAVRPVPQEPTGK